jgi:hypothetical protein
MVTHGLAVTSTGADSRCQVVPGRVGADATTMTYRIARPGAAAISRYLVAISRYRCGMNEPVLAGLLTDKYELTMLAAALRDGTADRRTTFELFARRLPDGRRYGVVGGTGRLLEALPQFRFDEDARQSLEQFLDPDTLGYLRDFRFAGDIDGYAEGELYFPASAWWRAARCSRTTSGRHTSRRSSG